MSFSKRSWQDQSKGGIIGAPTIANDMVYFGNYEVLRSAVMHTLGKLLLAFSVVTVLSLLPGSANAKSFKILHAFAGGDGFAPSRGPLIADKAGNLYGTTRLGGAYNAGTVFELAPNGDFRVLYSFAGYPHTYEPFAGLVADDAGNMYGAAQGGRYNFGAVFKITPSGKESTLYSFKGAADGSGLGGISKLVIDKQGNLYGTTSEGGGSSVCQNGCGTVFKIAADGTETVLHAFLPGSGDEGSFPVAGLLMDTQGNLFGTTLGGIHSCGYGTIFKITSDGTLSTLHCFKDRHEGGGPLGTLIADADGNLYGTAAEKGEKRFARCPYQEGCGTLFKLAPDETFTVLFRFSGGHSGARPVSGLLMDTQGTLYGTTYAGGRINQCTSKGCGTVFKRSPDGLMTILHNAAPRDSAPGDLFMGPNGAIYATGGGSEFGQMGVIFKLAN